MRVSDFSNYSDLEFKCWLKKRSKEHYLSETLWATGMRNLIKFWLQTKEEWFLHRRWPRRFHISPSYLIPSHKSLCIIQCLYSSTEPNRTRFTLWTFIILSCFKVIICKALGKVHCLDTTWVHFAEDFLSILITTAPSIPPRGNASSQIMIILSW